MSLTRGNMVGELNCDVTVCSMLAWNSHHGWMGGGGSHRRQPSRAKSSLLLWLPCRPASHRRSIWSQSGQQEAAPTPDWLPCSNLCTQSGRGQALFCKEDQSKVVASTSYSNNLEQGNASRPYAGKGILNVNPSQIVKNSEISFFVLAI